ncbi:MAG: aquaporin family protein [Aldersonia sp.]|nr:aquaporin family protein [Aldersonia sp.]
MAESLAECVGTFILILFGNGAVAVSVLTGAFDLWAVALMWFLGVALGVYASGAVSGGHINPAVTLGLATFADFPWRKVPAYVVAQIAGAFLASLAIFVPWSGVIAGFESSEQLTRGEPGSQLSGIIFTTYAPNPAIVGTDQAAIDQVSLAQWFGSEVIITAMLVFGIMYLIAEINDSRPLANLAPAMIGLLVAALVAYEAPVSMAALNPARDLGPRIFMLLAGWDQIAFPGPRGGWWIPTVSTIVGGLIGGAFYRYAYSWVFPKPAPVGRAPAEARGE